MKTRTLLLLAVACGLIILIAGGIKLLLVADAQPPAHLALGATSAVGDMSVTVVAFEQIKGLALATVSLSGVEDADGATTWVFGTAEAQLKPVAPPSGAGEECGATKQAQKTTCVLAFETTATTGVLRYQRAGEVRRWDVLESTPG